MPPTSPDPAPLPSQVFVAELGPARRRKGLSQQELADRLEDIGAPIDRSTIGKIEADKRKVSLDELFSFALALGVSPLALVVPRSMEKMSVSPGVAADTQQVVHWVRNLYPLWPSYVDPSEADERFFEEARTDREAAAYRNHPSLLAIEKLVTAMVSVAGSRESEDREQFARAASILGLLVDRIIDDAGGRVPFPSDLLSWPLRKSSDGKLSVSKLED